jgi:hypothetical protein
MESMDTSIAYTRIRNNLKNFIEYEKPAIQ